MRSGCEQACQRWGVRHHLFEVVEQQQAALLSQIRREAVDQRRAARLLEIKGTGNRCDDEGGVTQRGKVDEPDALRESVEQLGRDLEGQAGFARAAGTSQGDEAHIVPTEKLYNRLHVALAPDERVALDG